jgi:hypothetical protein
MLTPDWLMNPTTETPAPADRFRLGDIWRSPRGKNWQVDQVDGPRVRLLRIVGNQRTTQWRGAWDTGRDMTDAWERIESAAAPFVYPD